jgi:hypothetical protein
MTINNRAALASKWEGRFSLARNAPRAAPSGLLIPTRPTKSLSSCADDGSLLKIANTVPTVKKVAAPVIAPKTVRLLRLAAVSSAIRAYAPPATSPHPAATNPLKRGTIFVTCPASIEPVTTATRPIPPPKRPHSSAQSVLVTRTLTAVFIPDILPFCSLQVRRSSDMRRH